MSDNPSPHFDEDELAEELADALSVYLMDKRGSLFKCLMLALEETDISLVAGEKTTVRYLKQGG